MRASQRRFAGEVDAADLLVVGCPTHIRGMTSGFSRKSAGEEKAEANGEPAHLLELEPVGPGLPEWFESLPKVKGEELAAAFDPVLADWLSFAEARLPPGVRP
jgi:hypothetical protein